MAIQEPTLRTSDFDYDLPPEFIAQKPVEPRDRAKLMVVHRPDCTITHAVFRDLGRFLRPGDVLVVNRTRVIPARIFARKPTGGRVELLLVKQEGPEVWQALVRGRRVRPGLRLQVEGGPQVEVLADLGGPLRRVRFTRPVWEWLEQAGQVPLPPYIKARLEDPERYQTVFAREPGSAAAPTAGLHFTPELIARLKAQGIRFAEVTLHIGLDTFRPVEEEDPRKHPMHREWCRLDPETAALLNQVRSQGGRIVAVGTTSVRVLETAARQAPLGQVVAAFEGETDLFILPGFQFRAVDALITNFHLPRSTLLMLVSAFAGRECILHAYEMAKQHGYRFYSFGDAMLIL